MTYALIQKKKKHDFPKKNQSKNKLLQNKNKKTSLLWSQTSVGKSWVFKISGQLMSNLDFRF